MVRQMTTSFDTVKAGSEVITPLVTMPAGSVGSASISAVVDPTIGDNHVDLNFENQAGVTRLQISGGIDPDPAIVVPTFTSQSSLAPLGVVDYNADGQFAPMNFAELATELADIPVDQTVICLGYESTTPGVSALLAITDDNFATTNSYTCVGQVTDVSTLLLAVPLFTLTGTEGVSYTITVTSALRILDSTSPTPVLLTGGNVGTITWSTGDGAALNIESHSSLVPVSLLGGVGTGVGSPILTGTLLITPPALISPFTSTIGFKVDVTRVPASVPGP